MKSSRPSITSNSTSKPTTTNNAPAAANANNNPVTEDAMIVKLNHIAREKARNMIVDKFSSPDKLEDSGLLVISLEKELALVNTKLNSEVQTKLDSLKNAVDLMDESQTQLTKLYKNIEVINTRIDGAKTSISKTNYLKYVHNARENIQRVIEQVEFFKNAPKRVEELANMLESNPLLLREVFLESLKLDALRTAMTKELRVSQNRRMSTTDSTHNNEHNKLQSIRAAYSDATTTSVEKHLKMVPELVRIVRAKVFSVIERVFDISDETPALVVQAFEIIEMQQEYNDRRNAQLDKEMVFRKQLAAATALAGNSAGAAGAAGAGMIAGMSSAQIQQLQAQLQQSAPITTERHENIHVTVEQKLRELMDRLIEEEFATMASLLDQHGSKATAVRTIGTQVLGRMKYFQTTILPCIPPSYEAMFIFLEAFDMVMLDELKDVVLHMADMKVSDILDLISWLEFCMSSYRDFDPETNATREFISDIMLMKQELVMEYKERIKTQIHQWFTNITNQVADGEQDITKTNDGTLITSHPEDMFNIIHAQLNVAKEKLPPEYIKEVGIACLQVLQDVQRQSYDTLQKKVSSMDASELCAIVNDNQRMEEKCQEFTEEMLRYVYGAEEKEMLGNIANEVSMEYLQIANKAVSAIVRCILESMDDAVFGKLFSPEWENATDKEEGIIPILTATLEDYFGDLSEWLTYYHYTKLVRELLLSTVTRYVMSLRKRANGAFTFMNEIVAVNKVVKDHAVIQTFFEKYLEELQRGGLRPRPATDGSSATTGTTSSGGSGSVMQQALTEELEAMFWLTKVINCRSLTLAERDCKHLFEKYGTDGLRVAQAGFLSNPTIPKIDRQQICEQLKKMFDSQAAVKKYRVELMEEYKNFDASSLYFNTGAGPGGAGDGNNANVNNTNNSAFLNKARNFWGKKK